jgi:hypothetical protein
MEAAMTLGPDARALLDAAEGGDDPSFADAARVRSRIAARIAVSAAAGAAATLSTKPAAAAGSAFFGSVTAKVVLVTALVTGAATTGVVATRSVEEPPVRAAAPAPIAPTIARAATKPVSEPAPAPVRVPVPVPVRVTPAPSPKKPAPEAILADQVVEEAALLRRAHAAPDPNVTLSILAEHSAKYPRGVLAQEREGQRAIALCALGRRTEGRAVGGAFLAGSPRSPLAERVRAACEP